MEHTDIVEYIKEGYLLAIPALNGLGFAIKHTEIINDRFIPLVLVFLGVLFGIGIGGFNMTGLIQGILIGTAPVGIHQVFKVKDK